MYINPRCIEPTEILAGAIAIYENVWENPLKDIETINNISSDINSGVTFIKSQTIGEQSLGDASAQSIRTNYSLALTEVGKNNEEFRKINNKFYEKLNMCIPAYCKFFGIEENISDIEGYNLLKYNGGQHYGAHYDGGTFTKRSVSPILYLNDEYEGGEIEFLNFNIKVKPKSGSLIVFPSNYAYRHIAHPVTSGTKYAIVTWLHDQ
jgi:predicted 2-oxoglutarate/Fe(II)-dependent dioxygenase YbiX